MEDINILEKNLNELKIIKLAVLSGYIDSQIKDLEHKISIIKIKKEINRILQS